ILLAAGVAALGCAEPPAAPVPGPPVVTVAHPEAPEKGITEYTYLTGRLAAVEVVQLRPRVGGFIEKVFIRGRAEKGETSSSESAGSEVGDMVRAGQVLFQIDPSEYKVELQRAQAQLAQAEAELGLARATEKRLAALRRTGSVSQEEYEQAQAQAKVRAADVRAAEAAVAQAELNLQWTRVTSPIDGRVDRPYVTEGNLVTGGTSQGTVLTTIVSTDPIYGYFDVDQPTVLYYLRMIREGRFPSPRDEPLPVEIRLQGEPEGGYPHRGVLDFIGNQLVPGTGSLQIRAKFPNPGGAEKPPLLRPGMFVRGRIPRGTIEGALLVPEQAVATDQAEKVLYVVVRRSRPGPDGSPQEVAVVERREVEFGPPVELGPRPQDQRRVVVAGLTREEWVIVRGLARVQPGDVVAPQTADGEPVPPSSLPPAREGPGRPGPS
ncbi:MAG TPA: efflux RND transporter periplasmic adaptor subunit, partial [Gemmataceae bacterium]